MKNKLNLLAVLALGIFVTMGCGMIDRVQRMTSDESASNSQPTAPNTTNGNKTITDQAIESVADGETTGVKECDDAIRFINDQMKTPDDNWMTKGMKDYFAGQIKRQIRESIVQNQGDVKQMAQQCTELKNSFEKNLKEEQQKQKQ